MTIEKRTSYNPRACGALCDECPLNGQTVVPPESHANARVALIGEAPGEPEEKHGRPFVGPNGTELDRAIRASGHHRGKFHLTYTILCRPPDNDLAQMTRGLSKQAKLTGQVMKTPQECCAPRLNAEIAHIRDLIPLGKTAMQAVTGSSQSILAVRGALVELESTIRTLPRRVLPTVSPGLVQKQQRWAHVFRSDISKAMRAFNGLSGWVEPDIVYHPSAAEFRQFIDTDNLWTYDIETDGIEPLDANIRCIAIGNETKVMVIGLRSNKQPKEVPGLFIDFYDEEEASAMLRELRYFFENENIHKIGHNSGSYDRTVIRRRLGFDVKPNIDTIMIHRNVDPEMPHSLAYVASLYTDAPAWKCYDGETEILTDRGFVRFPDLEESDLVAQWDDGVISFVAPSAYVNQPYKGEMRSFKSQAVDLLVTPNHKMLVFTVGKLEKKIFTADSVPATGKFIHASVFRGHETVEDNFIKLVAATQADGSWVKQSKGLCIDFGFTKQRKVERLKAILNSCGMSFEEKKTGSKNPRVRLWVAPCEKVDKVYALLGEAKVFGPWLLRWSVEARNTLIDELPLWDGTKGEEHCNFNSAKEENVDYLQACAAISGTVTRKSKQTKGSHSNFRLSITSGKERKRLYSKIDGTERQKVDFDGRVYCVTVPSGFVVVRRNGKVVVSGNSDREGNKIAHGGENDHQLHEYAARDVAVTARVLPPLLDALEARDQLSVYKLDMQIQEICMVMHTTGMFVDQAIRHKKEVELLTLRHNLLHQIRDTTGLRNFNPASVNHLRDLLFDRWKLSTEFIDEEDRYTESGDLSTGDYILRGLLTDGQIEEDHRAVIKLIRRYRKCQKVLGTYVVKLRPSNMGADLGWDEDEDWVDKETRKQYGEEKRGIVNPATGRMYPGYSAHIAATGRLSSSKPINCFDAETEILTEIGWVRFDVLLESHQGKLKVAQWHEDGKIDFSLPTAYHCGRHTGYLVDYSSQSCNLRMTPNHRIPLIRGKSHKSFSLNEIITVTAEELIELKNNKHTIHSGVYSGQESTLSADEIRLAVALQADSHVVVQNGKAFGLDICFTKQRKADRFQHLLDEVKVEANRSKGDRYRWYIPAKDNIFLEKISRIFAWKKKRWLPDLIHLRADLADVFLDEITFWDGCFERKSMYSCKDDKNTDLVQALYVLRGHRANSRYYESKTGSYVYSIDVRRNAKTNAITDRRVVEKVDYDGMVYCVTVPSDAIVVRRKGKVTITRQSQNFPKAMRSMIVPQPGHVLVGADMDQLELRVAAARWGVELYLRAFREGKDPHGMTAYAVFGNDFCRAAGVDPSCYAGNGMLVGKAYDEKGKFIGKGEAKTFRDLSKGVQYCSQYMGSAETTHKLIRKTEVPASDPVTKEPLNDGTTDLPYAKLPLQKVRVMQENWLRGAPQFKTGWQAEIETYRKKGYLREPVTGRRRDFLDGEKANEIVNFPIQSSAAAIMNLAMVKLYEQIPLHKWGPGTGIINQCHDAIVIECPEGEGERVARLLEECMNQVHDSLPGVEFTASADIGKSWDKV